MPASITLHGTVNGFPTHMPITEPHPDTWYAIGIGVVTSYVQFGEYPDPGAIAESKPSFENPSRLTVSPSVVTRQMTVRLLPVGNGRQAVEIHDAVGNLIRSLDFTAAAQGAATAIWNREDEFGRLVPEGVYFCRYSAADVIAVRKILVAR